MTKEKIIAAELTPDLFGTNKKRGRPRSPVSKTGAERQAAFRARQLGDTMESTLRRLSKQFDLPIVEVRRHLIRFALCNRNWAQTGFPSAD